MTNTQHNQPNNESYSHILWSNMRKSKLTRWTIRLLTLIAIVALLANFIANEKPLYCKIDNETHFPVFHQYAVDAGWSTWDAKFVRLSWQDHNYQSVIWPPIPYSYNTIDHSSFNYVSPMATQSVKSLRFRHWLGTDKLGRDVLAGLIHGTKIALLIGLVAMGLSTLLGILFGVLAGYFGDDSLFVSWLELAIYVLGVFFAIFYAFIARGHAYAQGHFITQFLISIIWFFGILLLFHFLAKLAGRYTNMAQHIALPIDSMIMRIIEVLNAVPALLLILAVVATMKKASIFNLMIIIGFISWTGIARFVRAEMLKVKNMEYIQAAQALGFSQWRIIFRHALPNAISPVLVAVSFGIASAILLEAGLSFLGIGVPPEAVTWGTMLNESRSASHAWWMVIFPGVAIFVTITIFNILGDALTKAVDARRR